MRPADTWQDYELLDATNHNRLERWGSTLLIRPDPQIIWHARSGADFALQWLRAEIVRHWKDHAPVPEARAR